MKKFLGKGKGSKAEDTEAADRNALFGGRKTQPARRLSSESTASRNTVLPAYQETVPSARNGYDRTNSDMDRKVPYNNNGYASDPYANDPYATSGPSTNSRRGGGAPDFSHKQSSSTIAQRDELFRGAQPDRRLQPSSYGAPDMNDGNGNNDQLQTQEEEDEDIEGIKQEIRYVKQESLSSTRNALRLANEAEESGRSTLTKLAEQSDSLANAEQAIDLSKLANRDAQVKARELKNLNRSMFALQVNKPWGKNKRLEADELRVRQQYDDDSYARQEREDNRKESERRQDANLKAHAALMGKQTQRQRIGLAERSKYQFEANEEDDEVEGEIDDNLDQLAAITSRLKGLAQATNTEVSKQNQQLDRLDRKGDGLSRDIYMNTHRLKKIGEM